MIDTIEHLFYIYNITTNGCSKKENCMEREDKQKALEAALGQIEKQFGKGAVMKLGDSSDTMNI